MPKKIPRQSQVKGGTIRGIKDKETIIKDDEDIKLIQSIIAFTDGKDSKFDTQLCPLDCNRYDLYIVQRLSTYKRINVDEINESNRLGKIAIALVYFDLDEVVYEDNYNFAKTFNTFYLDVLHDDIRKSAVPPTSLIISPEKLRELLVWLSWLRSPAEYFSDRDWLEDCVSYLVLILKTKPKEPHVSLLLYIITLLI